MKLKIITISISAMIFSINIAHAAEKKDKNDIYNYDSVLEYSSTYVNKKAANSNIVVIQTQDMSSNPIKNSYSCESYRGQYDIDSKAVGTFFLITEGNPRNKYYGKIIGSDNSSCYQECTPKTTTETQSCASKNGDGWTGNYTTSTPFSCTAGEYLREEAKTTSNNCVAPVPPVPVSCPENTTYCEGLGVGGGGVILKYGYLTYDRNTCQETKTAVGSERFGSQQLQERGSQDCDYPFGSYQEPSLPAPSLPTCTYIKPTQTGSLYICKNPDGTSFYTEEPPIDEPEPICPMVSGFEAKQGAIEKACDIWGSAGVYPAGQNYLCTYDGWRINNKGNSQYLNYCE